VIWGAGAVLVLDIILQSVFRATNFGVENRGVSFGAMPEVGKIISILAFGIFIAWFVFELVKYKKFRPFLFLIALGGLGNIIGRLVWGSVWDYVCLPLVPFCFNLSDVLISFGVVSYILGIDGNRSSLRG
jgi:lipoprotein signal peptidase